MTAIPLSTPVVIPATDEKTYDEVWVSYLQVVATDPNAPVRVVATVERARELSDGSKELMPSGQSCVVIDDFFAQASLEELNLMGGLIMAIKTRAGV